MTAKQLQQTPKYRLHKATGQALVELDGQRFYLSRYGSAASRQAYHRLIVEWLPQGRLLPVPPGQEIIRHFLAGRPLAAYSSAAIRRVYTSAPWTITGGTIEGASSYGTKFWGGIASLIDLAILDARRRSSAS